MPTLHRIAQEQRGFTLIELLVVILIIGILAAIALPTFLGQQKKGQDASAKSNARNLVSHVESCFADGQNYAVCQTAAQLGATGLDIGTGLEQVAVTAAGTAPANTFTVTAYSKSGNTFQVSRTATGVYSRVCTIGSSGSGGGCKVNNGSW